MRLPSKSGLKGRAIMLCAILLLGAVGLLATALIWQNYADSLSRMTYHARVYAEAISRAAESPVLLNDEEALQHIVDAAEHDATVEKAVIVNANGKTLAIGSHSSSSEPTAGIPVERTTGLETSIERMAGMLRVIAPICRSSSGVDLGIIEDEADPQPAGDTPVGYVSLTYSLASVQDELAEGMLSSVLIACVVIVLGIGATMIAVRQLLMPLRNLVATTTAIAEGDLTRRAGENAFGEIGTLARSFNHMAHRLQETYAGIEQTVRDRTNELEAEIAERQRAEKALRAGERRLRRQNEAIVALSKGRFAEEGKLQLALREITRVASETLEVARVGVWFLNEDHCLARCSTLYSHTNRRYSSGEQFSSNQFPSYFRALEHDRTIAAHDARSDPRTTEFTDTYLEQNSIGSLLDAPIRLDGGTIGVIRHEHIGTTREWSLEEQHFAGWLADLIALAVEAAQRRNAEAVLRQAKEAAEAANLAKSDFLANMSHELRTPLTAIIGFSELLQKQEGKPSDREEWTESIASNGRHLLALINDILDLSRIEAQRLEIEMLDCDVHQVIDEAVAAVRQHADEAGLALEIDIDPAMPAGIKTDITRLRQLLVNLLSNAVKFTEHGVVKLLARHVQREQGPRLRVQISDTGVGIPADKLEVIFDPFAQADSSVTRRFGGTGLGLAISRRIAEALGGSLTASSELGHGSTFVLEVSAEIATTPPEEVHVTTQSRTPRPATEGKTLHGRVLLVEDGPDNQRLISFLLRRAGAEVEMAENGQVGVECAEREHFDVILMDMQMPVMDGYTATRLLRQRGYKQPIIALTAHAMSGDAEKCLAAGCSAYLTKPIDAKTLLATLHDAMESDDQGETSIPSERSATTD